MGIGGGDKKEALSFGLTQGFQVSAKEASGCGGARCLLTKHCVCVYIYIYISTYLCIYMATGALFAEPASSN